MLNGVKRVSTPTWPTFSAYVSTKFLDFTNYIYRGQASDRWPLESSLDRTLRRIGELENSKIRERHLERFKYAARGRRGMNPPKLESDNEWWALGQHNGLVTPLLDWTTSPYVAAYFAFAGAPEPDVERRVVFALSYAGTTIKSSELKQELGATAPTLEFVRPLSDENPRLVSQGGLFTRAPDGMTIEEWVEKNMSELTARAKVTIYRIEIPETERLVFLRNLNRMNINHLTLFPDLYGAGRYGNFGLEIDKY